MSDVFRVLLNIAVVVFAVSSMFGVGLAHTVHEVIGPLRNMRAIVRALVANFLLVPALALLVLRVLALPEPHAIGVFLIASAAGAPFLIRLSEVADSDVALSATLLVLLLPATIVFMPVVLPLALPRADVSMRAIAMPLLLTMLVPLAAGLLVRARIEHVATRILPFMTPISTVALVVLVLATVAANVHGILAVLFTTTIVAALVVIAGAFVIGYVLGTDRASREVLGLGTSQRNIAAATVVASRAIQHPGTVLTVVVSLLAGFALLFPIAGWLRRRSELRSRT